MRNIIKKRNENEHIDEKYISTEVAMNLKEAKNIRLEKDITIDILEFLLLKRLSPPITAKKTEKLSRVQKIYIIVMIALILLSIYSILTRMPGFNEENEPFTIIDDFSQYRYLNCFGKEKMIAATVNEMQRISNIIDKCDEELIYKLLKPTSKNFLFYGPPGTGKTLFIKKLAFQYDIELRCKDWFKNKPADDKSTIEDMTYEKCMKQRKQVKLFLVQPSSLIDKYVGSTEKHIRNLFLRAAEESKKYTVMIFIDEIDAFFSNRDKQNSTEHGRNSQNEFLQSLDGAKTPIKSKIFVFGATNFEKDMDAAFLRRMPRQQRFDLPNEVELAVIIQKFMEGNEWIEKEKIEHLAYLARGMSQNDIATAVSELMGRNGNYSHRFTYEEFEDKIRERQESKERQGIVPISLEISDKEKAELNYLKFMPGVSWKDKKNNERNENL